MLSSAIKSLRTSRGTTMAAILTLAIGTGASTAVVALAYGVLLRPLPYHQPDRLVLLSAHRLADNQDLGIGAEETPRWMAALTSTESVAAFTNSTFTVRGAGDPTVLRASAVTGSFFDVLGAQPQAGRAFSGDVDNVAVVSARAASRFDSSGSAVGRVITIGDRAFTVAAVMPPSFAFPSAEIDLWLPARALPGVPLFGAIDRRNFRAVARLRAGVSTAQAEQDAQSALQTASPGTSGRRMGASVLSDVAVGHARPALYALLAAGTLLLLVACANVATLLVSRTLTRHREYALRLSLGSTRAAIVRSSLMETSVIALTGSLLGLLLARATLGMFLAVAGAELPRLDAVRIDGVVAAISIAIGIGVTLLCGLAPALGAAEHDLAAVMRRTASTTTPRGRRLRAVLVVGQLALAICLLVSAGLLGRTVWTLLGTDTGATHAGALTVQLPLSETVSFNAAGRGEFVDRLLARVRELPGVEAAGVGSNLPPRTNQLEMTFKVLDDQDRDRGTYGLNLVAATPGFLRALGVKLISGREFDERENLVGEPVAIMSQQFARQLDASRDFLNQQMNMSLPSSSGKRVRPRVVGIAADVRYVGLESAMEGNVYVPWRQLPIGSSFLVVRTSGDPSTLAPAVLRVIRELDPTMPLSAPRTLEEEMSAAVAPRVVRLQLIAAIAALAILLAGVGLAGALVRSVTERRREIAIRRALGATSTGAARLLVSNGLRLTAVAIVLGLGLAALAGRALATVVFGVSPYDPLTYTVVAGGALLVAFAASYLPARRASRINPIELLRDG